MLRESPTNLDVVLSPTRGRQSIAAVYHNLRMWLYSTRDQELYSRNSMVDRSSPVRLATFPEGQCESSVESPWLLILQGTVLELVVRKSES